MTNQLSNEISHYVDGEVHGPVRLFIADDGRIAFVCEVDGVGWELPSHARRQESPTKAANADEDDEAVEVDEVDVPDEDGEIAALSYADDNSPPGAPLESSILAVRRMWA